MTQGRTRLGDVCKLINGGAWTQDKYADNGVPVVRVSDMKEGTVDVSDLKYLSPTYHDQYRKHTLQPGDLVIATVGSHKTESSAAGRATVIPDYCAGMLLNQNAVCLRAASDSLDQTYLCYLGQSSAFQHYVREMGKGAASQMRIALSAIRAFEFEQPSIAEQKRVAGILSAYDDLIANNKHRIALLEESARLLYREWFVHLRFPGHEHVEVVDGVPEGWERATVADLGDVVTGKTPSTKDPSNYGGKMPFVKTPDMHNAPIVIETEKCLTEKGARSQANKTLPPGSIMVTCIGTVGVVSMNDAEAHTNQQINSVIPKHDYLRHYAFLALSDFKARLEAIGGGATMSNVNKTKFMSLPITLPSKFLLGQFENICKPAFSQIAILLKQNQRLRAARDLLLPRLMNGDIAV